MDKQGKIRVVVGCVLVTASVFAALSLISRTIALYMVDSLASSGTITDSNLPNWCGSVGEFFARNLMSDIGAPASYFGVGLAVFWAYQLFTAREKLSDVYLKLFGSVLLILSVSAIAALAGGAAIFTSAFGNLASSIIVTYFGQLGAYLLLLLTAFLSLLLATDFLVVAPVGRFLLGVVRFLEAVVVKLIHSLKRRKAEGRPVPPARVTRPEDVARPARAAKTEAPPAREQAPPAAPEPLKQLDLIDEPPVRKPVFAPRPAGDDGYELPSHSLLDEVLPTDVSSEDDHIQEKAKILEDTLAEFGVSVNVVGIETGPVITQYEIELAPGIKVNRVVSLSDDIAMALKAPSVRIVAPIPGRDSVGVEVPNTKKTIVRLKGLMEERPPEEIGILPVYLGRDAQGDALVADLTEMPHLLIAGATGSGKSVCINSVILSILMKQHPEDVKLLLVDPKMVELSVYKDVPNLICPVVTDMKRASTILEWACVQMDSRYDLLAAANVRHISRYNKLGAKGLRERLGLPSDAEIELPDKMPYIIIIIDELADLMMIAAKDVETSITRLAQKSRAVGIHLVLATQRPSVDVITGLIKSNLPARLSFKVSSKIDSRTILDQNGADKLLGRGDMLYLPPATAKLIRAQGSFVSDDEIRQVVDYVKSHSRPAYDEELVEWESGGGGGGSAGAMPEGPSGRDPLYDQAVQIVIENQRGSVSLLQRRLEIGYSRAARLIDFMAEGGILGPYKGSQAREVLFTPEEWEEMQKASAKRAL